MVWMTWMAVSGGDSVDQGILGLSSSRVHWTRFLALRLRSPGVGLLGTHPVLGVESWVGGYGSRHRITWRIPEGFMCF